MKFPFKKMSRYGLKITALGLLITGSFNAFCQTTDTIGTQSGEIRISYLKEQGSFGLKAGITLPQRRIDKIKTTRKRGLKTITKTHALIGTIGWNHHKNFHDRLSLTTGFLSKKRYPTGFFGDWVVEGGYCRTFLGGTTYRVTGNGEVSLVKAAGYNYALIAFGGGFGVDFLPRYAIPLSVYARLNITGLFPSNSILYFTPNLEVGLSLSPASLFMKKIKIVTKKNNKLS